MTISASNFTVEHIPGVAKSATAWFHTTDPGTFAVTYPTGITGPATVTAAGSRKYEMMNRSGDGHCYGDADSTKQRDPCTIYCAIPFVKIQKMNAYWRYNYALQVCQSYKKSNAALVNYFISFYRPNGYANYLSMTFYMSKDNSTNAALWSTNVAVGLNTLVDSLRIALTISGRSVKLNTSIDNAAPVEVSTTLAYDLVGTVGDEALLLCDCSEYAHWSSVITGTDFTNLVRYGTIPAGANVVYLGNEESGNVLYDTSGNLRDSTLDADSTYPSTGIARIFTDTGFTSPLVEVPITIAADCTAGAKSITLRRTRVGIPARVPALPDAVVYDDGVVPVTITNPTTVIKVGPRMIYQVYLP